MIVYRAQKGSALTIAEVDGNFSYLDGRIDEIEGVISDVEQDGQTISLVLADGRRLSFLLPSAGVADAPADGEIYGRQDSGWVAIEGAGVEEAPEDGQQYVRRNADWEVAAAGGGGGMFNWRGAHQTNVSYAPFDVVEYFVNGQSQLFTPINPVSAGGALPGDDVYWRQLTSMTSSSGGGSSGGVEDAPDGDPYVRTAGAWVGLSNYVSTNSNSITHMRNDGTESSLSYLLGDILNRLASLDGGEGA